MQDNKKTEIPDFKTLSDFSTWAESLKEEEIQSWRTKDWNKMYEKLFAFINKSEEIEAEIPEFLKIRKIDVPVTEFSQKELELARRLVFIDKQDAVSALAKLYANYRMEKENVKKIYDLAVEAGKKAAETGEISAAKTWMGEYAYKTGIKDKSTLSHDANLIEKIVYEQSSYPEELEKLGYLREGLRADIKLDSSPFNAGSVSNAHRKPEIHISHRIGEDAPLDAMFHESAHAHLQILKYGLKDKFATIKPRNEFDDDFVKLMVNNEMLYLIHVPIEKGYRNQPREYFAHLYGHTAERSFRRKSKQYSERAIFSALEHLSFIDEKLCKSITLSNDKDGNTVFKLPNNDYKKKLENLFAGENNPWKDKIKIEKDGNNTILHMKYTGFPQKLWRELEVFKVNEFAKAFTSKNKYQIEMGREGCAKIRFDKKLPYTNEEMKEKIKGQNIEIDENNSVLTVPSVYSKEFDQLLSLFKKDKIGFCEAEQKRDAIKRYRRMKTNKIIQNFKSIFSGRH